MLIGANYHEGTCEFTVWAPYHKKVTLSLEQGKQQIEMKSIEKGYWTAFAEKIKPSTEYMYQLDTQALKPDPASHFQPNGVFGPSMVVDHKAFKWKDSDWHGLDLKELVFYEVHVGTFTPEGNFKAMLNRIKELAEFGVNAVELMPVSQFSGARNWGYDGVFPFAVQNSYGTPDDLKMLVNECHLQGIALFVDFVYNHTGPEGSYLNDFGPYFRSDQMTSWGPTINLDGKFSDGVRNYFLENTLHWFRNYHIDGIRLDAVLSMPDGSPKHFLQELNEAVAYYAKETSKRLHLVAESGFNEPKVLKPIKQGGYGFDAQWLDDFQHALYALLTGEKEGYYKSYGKIQDLIEVLIDAYVYVCKDPTFRRREPDESYRWIPAYKFVVFSQNHDQVGNRLLGDRLAATTAGFEAAKVAAGIVLLSPYVPLLFMGEEYGETAPFLFFTDYSDNGLANATREGRKKEFAEFHWEGEVPDPQSVETFEKSKINWQLRYQDKESKIAAYYKALIQLRKKTPAFQLTRDRNIESLRSQGDKVLFIKKQRGDSKALIIANLIKEKQKVTFPLEVKDYVKVLDSADALWGGPGASLSDKAENQVISGFNLAVYTNKGMG